MGAILPFNLAPNAAPDLATAYWRSCCCAAGYANDNAARLALMAGLVGLPTTRTIPLPLPLPNRVYLLSGAAGVVVQINGTTDPQQYLTSAIGAALAPNPFGGGRVNSSFAASAVLIGAIIRPLLIALAPARVIYVGHSLGGAVAQLLAAQTQPWPVVGGWSIGQPRVGDSVYATGYALELERYTTVGDPVPLLPPSANALIDLTLTPTWGFFPPSYRHAGIRRHVAPNGAITSPAEVPSWIEGTDFLLAVVSGSHDWYSAHATTSYG